MKKKILFVINTLGRAGAETALISMLNVLDPQLYEISLFVLVGQGEMVSRLPKYVKLLNTNYDPSPVLSAQGEKRLKKTILKAAFHRGTVVRLCPYLVKNFFAMRKKGHVFLDKLLWRLLSDGAPRFEEEFDLAVAYLEGGSTYYVADHVKAKKKAAFLHVDYEKAGYTRQLDHGAYACFQKIFTVSEEVTESFCHVYPEYRDKVEVFSNIMNCEEIREKAKLPGGFTDDYHGIRILTIGRLTIQKAFEVSIEAMSLVKKQGIDARWYVLGDGDQREVLEKQIQKLGLEKDFLLLGAVDNPYPYLAQTDLYVHASRFEGKSIAIREAQILGCCILVSDCSGNREQVDNGVDGVLSKLTPEDLCAGIIDLIKHPEKRKALAAAAKKRPQTGKEEAEKLLSLMNGRN